MNKTKSIKTNKYPRKHILIGLIIVTVLLFDVFVTGFIKFGYNVVRCGGMPVKITTTASWGGGSWYDTPGTYFPIGAQSEYVCTEQQAVDMGVDKSLH